MKGEEVLMCGAQKEFESNFWWRRKSLRHVIAFRPVPLSVHPLSSLSSICFREKSAAAGICRRGSSDYTHGR